MGEEVRGGVGCRVDGGDGVKEGSVVVRCRCTGKRTGWKWERVDLSFAMKTDIS